MNIKNIFSQFKEGLYKTREEFANNLGFLFSNSKDKIDFLEKLEELLILSDLGTSATAEIMNEFQQINFREYKENDFIFFKEKLKVILIDILNSTATDIKINENRLNIIMLVGVNGSGKTSIAGKIAYRLININNDIIMVPADTFRAAANEQLEIWAERAGVEIIKRGTGADPSSVIYDSLVMAKKNKIDVVIVDTAGRLHTKHNLMEELIKIKDIYSLSGAEFNINVLRVLRHLEQSQPESVLHLFPESPELRAVTVKEI